MFDTNSEICFKNIEELSETEFKETENIINLEIYSLTPLDINGVNIIDDVIVIDNEEGPPAPPNTPINDNGGDNTSINANGGPVNGGPVNGGPVNGGPVNGGPANVNGGGNSTSPVNGEGSSQNS